MATACTRKRRSATFYSRIVLVDKVGLYELNGQATLAYTSATDDDELVFPQKLQHRISSLCIQGHSGWKCTLDAILTMLYVNWHRKFEIRGGLGIGVGSGTGDQACRAASKAGVVRGGGWDSEQCNAMRNGEGGGDRRRARDEASSVLVRASVGEMISQVRRSAQRLTRLIERGQKRRMSFSRCTVRDTTYTDCDCS